MVGKRDLGGGVPALEMDGEFPSLTWTSRGRKLGWAGAGLELAAVQGAGSSALSPAMVMATWSSKLPRRSEHSP